MCLCWETTGREEKENIGKTRPQKQKEQLDNKITTLGEYVQACFIQNLQVCRLVRRGKGGEKEKERKLWQSWRKCSLYSPKKANKNTKKNPKQQTPNNKTLTLKKRKAKKRLQIKLSHGACWCTPMTSTIALANITRRSTTPSLLHFAL